MRALFNPETLQIEAVKGLRTGLTLHRHRRNDSCIKMGSDESYFNVTLP